MAILYFNSLLKNTVIKNFFSLSLIQFFNAVLPFVTIPYLTRTLGIEKFGIVSYVQVFITYFVSLADYGFITTATREISINRNNKQVIARIYSGVISLKFILTIGGFLVFLFIIFSVNRFRQEWPTYLLAYSFVVGQTLLPVWFFQGMEEMKYLSLFNVVGKVIFTVLIFVLIKSPEDYMFVALYNGIGALCVGIVSFIFIREKFGIRFVFADIHELLRQLKEGWHIFLSNFAITIYMNSGIVILGFFASPIVIGYYSIADKIVFSSRVFLVVVSQSIFPYVCRLAEQSKELTRKFLKKTWIFLLAFMSCVAAIFFTIPDLLLRWIAGYSNENIVLIMRILSFAPLIIAMNIPPIQLLLCLNFKSAYSRIFLWGALISIIVNLILSYLFLGTGTAISVIITELFITTGVTLTVERKFSSYSILKA